LPDVLFLPRENIKSPVEQHCSAWRGQGVLGFFESLLAFGAIHLLTVVPLFVLLRLSGWLVRDYFVLSWPSWRDLVMYSGVALGTY
jgi:hypothetical protein